MTYPPKVTTNVIDGGLGLLAAVGLIPLVIGGSSAGVAGTLYQFSNARTVKDTLGTGDATELAGPIADQIGCLVLKTATTTAGANSAVVKTAIGTSTGTITLAGAPFSRYRGLVTITATGALGIGRFKYSLDNGFTPSEDLVIPSGGTYVIAGTNITITFVAGAGPVIFETGDTHTWTSTAPMYTTADLGTAIGGLFTQLGAADIKQVYFAGKHASAAAAATMFAAISTHMATLEAHEQFARAIMDAGTDSAANIKTSFAAVADRRISAVFGDADVATPLTYQGYGVPRMAAMNCVAERCALAALSENPGRFLSGPLRGVRAITQDEGANTQFAEADKITTLRTYNREAGFYVTNGFLKSPSGSDFQYYDYGRVIDVVCSTLNAELRRYILSKKRALLDGTGRIDPRDAETVDTELNQALAAAIMEETNPEGYKGHASGTEATIDRNNNILSTRQLIANSATVPLTSVDGVTLNVGFARSII